MLVIVMMMAVMPSHSQEPTVPSCCCCVQHGMKRGWHAQCIMATSPAGSTVCSIGSDQEEPSESQGPIQSLSHAWPSTYVVPTFVARACGAKRQLGVTDARHAPIVVREHGRGAQYPVKVDRVVVKKWG